jgi:N-acetylmuramate 1-kinase
VIDGFILAAGEGRRLRPASLSCPKALVPFCGVPLLELIASQLTRLTVNRVVVNCCYHGDRVAEATARLRDVFGWNLLVSQEDRLLNTGGGIRQGVELLPHGEHVLVHNVDVILDVDLQELIDHHVRSEAAATLLLVPGRGPQTVDMGPDGIITDFRRPPGKGRYTFSGVQILRRDALQYLPTSQSPSIIEAYEAALKAGELVVGMSVGESYWADLGTEPSYIRAHAETADCPLRRFPRLRQAQGEQARRRGVLEAGGVRCTGALGVGESVSVPAGGHLHNVVLWDKTEFSAPLLYADGVFVGGRLGVPGPVTMERKPDPRVFSSLRLSAEDCLVENLPKQGSGRRYCRLSAGDQSWVWCAYDPHRRENASFCAIANFLERLSVRVPSIVLHLADVGEIVSRDLGQHDLQRLHRPQQVACLHQVASQIARLHVLGDKAARLEEFPLQPGFTKGLYDWERDYFREHMLRGVLGVPEWWADVAGEYCELRSLLLQQPLVPIHRDLQSANIMVAEEEAYLIDFQGMRLGCAAYDLGALLYDPYQGYDRDVRKGIWQYYRGNVEALGERPPDDDVLYAAAIQRLLQALGAYGKLWLQDGLEWYRQFIIPGLEMLAAASGENDDRPEMHRLASRALERARKKLPASPDHSSSSVSDRQMS